MALEDPLGPSLAQIRGVDRLCAPADVNGADPAAPSLPDELTSHMLQRVRDFQRLRDVVVSNALGTSTVDLVRPIAVLIPSAKSLVGPPSPLDPAGVDHYRCYRTRGATERGDITVVDDQGTYTVKKRQPQRLCLAAAADGGSILDPSTHLLCYRIVTDPRRGPRGDLYHLRNELGAFALKTRRTAEVCLRSTVTLP